MSSKKTSPVLNEINRAITLCQKGQREKAAEILADLPSTLEDNREIRFQFGKLCYAMGNFNNAYIVFNELDKKYPDNPDFLYFLGDSLKELGKYEESKTCLNHCLTLNPNDWRIYASLGALFIVTQRYTEALDTLEKAIQLKPSHAGNYSNIAICYMRLNRHEESLEYAKKAIKHEPGNIHPYNSIGYALSELGRAEEAEEYFRKAIKIDKLFGIVYLNYSRIKTFSDKDSKLIKRMESLLGESMPAAQRANFHFSLGKIYDDCKKWDKAFPHYKQGNLLMKSGKEENPIPEKLLKNFRNIFTPDLINRYSEELGHTSKTPVFIIGMPRSGTTLLEQIISSHKDADGAGELTKIGEINREIYDYNNLKNFKKNWSDALTKQNFNNYAEEYLKILKQGNNSALRIVDKMPENYFHLGFLSILFPKAKFIHIKRSPLDTCLSCYFTQFSSINWAYDFEWIAKRYDTYRKTIALWQSVLPQSSILNIDYENLVHDQETYSKSIIDFIGLDWDPNCLKYYEKERAVQTASVWQVRQPLYKKSIRRWENYSQHIEPLAGMLKPYLESEDLDALGKAGIKIKKTTNWWKPFS